MGGRGGFLFHFLPLFHLWNFLLFSVLMSTVGLFFFFFGFLYILLRYQSTIPPFFLLCKQDTCKLRLVVHLLSVIFGFIV